MKNKEKTKKNTLLPDLWATRYIAENALQNPCFP